MAAKTFYDILKGNPYHDEKGRFTTGPSARNPMIRTDPPPKKTKIAYKVFVARDGKLYPPMVANPGAMDTPVGVWLDAAEGTLATDKDGNPITNTLGRNKVKAGGKGTQGGGGTLAYRPGWHLGELPEAKQFYTKDKVTGEKKQKKNFVWAECEIAADFDYQEEAMSYGYNKNGKFQHSLAGLPKIPKDGYYTYRTNPDPSTEPWYITGSMKVNRILTDAETNAILRSHGHEPMKRDGGELNLKALGFTETNFVKKSDGEENSFSIFKSDLDKPLVFGWASISITVDGEQLEDRQHDLIDPEDLEEAAYEYVLNFRDTGEEHISSMRKKGKLVESCVFTAEKQKAIGIPEGTLPIGWWIGFKIEDDAAWERVKNGTYRMFSIEGKANREPVEKAVENVETQNPVAKTFNEILKFNPYHGKDGRFTSANSATQFTYAPGKSKAHDMAIAREKERHKKEQEEQEKPITITLNQRYKEMANNWTHMRDKGAFVEREANKQLDAFRDEFKSGDYSDEQKAYLKQREKEYADLLTEKYNDQLYREGSNPSAMMAGPAKFDQRKFERKFEAEMRSQEEYRNKQQKFVENTKKQLERMEPEEKQIARWRQGKWKHGESIASDDPLAEKKLQAKLDYHVEQQQKMKDANAYYRKNGSMQGFEGFNDATNKKIDAQMQDYKDRGWNYLTNQPFQSSTLSNNNASIKSTRDRLTQFQNRKQSATQPGGKGGATKFEGGQLVRNTDINRLQIKFDSIPDAATRQKLKSSGWRWSPREGAWQRQLTDNAERSANSILGITKSMRTAVAKTFDELIELAKFNPYHDSHGRFASASGYATFTIQTRDPKKQYMADMAIAREKERAAAASQSSTNDPDTLAGVKRGKPMTHEQADEGRGNPHYADLEKIDKLHREAGNKHWDAIKRGAPAEEIAKLREEEERMFAEYDKAYKDQRLYRINCQSCVVAYEARRRGYDVEATGRDKKNATQEELARKCETAWIDPSTGKAPTPTVNDPKIRTSKQAQKWLEENVEEGGRYELSHGWKGTNGRWGHIVTVEKDKSGNLSIFDPQNGKTYAGNEFTEYMGRVKSTYSVQQYNPRKRSGWESIPHGRLQLLRVDKLQINPDVANAVLKGANQ